MAALGLNDSTERGVCQRILEEVCHAELVQRCYISSDDETVESVVLQPKRLGRKLG